MQFVVRSRLDVDECRSRIWRETGGTDTAAPDGMKWLAEGHVVGDALRVTVIATRPDADGHLEKCDAATLQGTLTGTPGETVVAGRVWRRFPTRQQQLVAAVIGIPAMVAVVALSLADSQMILPLFTLITMVLGGVWFFRRLRFGSESEADREAIRWLECAIDGKADPAPAAQ